MPLVLDVQPSGFADAVRVLGDEVADRVVQAYVALEQTLHGAAGMAGSDAAGSAWGGAYDDAAANAATATQDLVNACFRLAALLEQSGINYDRAEAAVVTGSRGSAGHLTSSTRRDLFRCTFATGECSAEHSPARNKRLRFSLQGEGPVSAETVAFVRRLADQVPEVAVIVQKHVDEFKTLLPHVVFGDVSRWAQLEVARDPRSASLQRLLQLLDAAHETEDASVRELIEVSFVENLDDGSPLIAMTSHLR